MSIADQHVSAKALDQTSITSDSKQLTNLNSNAYSADALNDWQKTFGAGNDTKSDALTRSYFGKPDEIFKPFEGVTKTDDGLPEFKTRPTSDGKTGIDYITGKAKELLGIGDTLHDRVKELVVAGLTPAQREAYLKEEKEWKEMFGGKYGPYSPELESLKNHPSGPMHDLVDKMTSSTEKKIAEEAKRGMSPMQRLQAERGVISGDSNSASDAYQQKLLGIVAGYESKGSLPAGMAEAPKPEAPAKNAAKQADDHQPADAHKKVVSKPISYKNLMW